jgi:acylphosphatase
MAERIARRLRVHGRVQGVGYRNYIEFKAAQHAVGGWVRNCSDGSVEAVVCGTPDAVAALIECAKRGPRASVVERIDIDESLDEHDNFSRLPTA